MFAEVAVPVLVRQTFSYRLSPIMADRARPGSRVIVQFGKRLLTGFIVAIYQEPSTQVSEADIKDVEELVDESPVITAEILELTRWMADYYYAPWGECLRTALPAGAIVTGEQLLAITDAGRDFASRSTAGDAPPSLKLQTLELLTGVDSLSSRELERHLSKPTSAIVRELERAGLITVSQRAGESRLKPKLQNAVRLLDRQSLEVDGTFAKEVPTPGNSGGVNRQRKPLNEAQRRVIDLLVAGGEPMALSHLLDKAEVSSTVVRTLEKRGIVEVFAREVRRDPMGHIAHQHAGLITLNDEQQGALDQIAARIAERRYATFLLHGVTGSGKTEIYIRAMSEAIRGGMTALMLVPEIALTPVFSRRLRAHFGALVAILHSSLSEGERTDEWRRIKEGEARVVIGTRSAVFAPLEGLGLIVVDEEHDTSYKQDETPRYSGRDTAIMRARNADAVVVLGSATPSLESFHNARTDKYSYIRLEKRYGDRALAEVQTVDMRDVFKRHGKQQTFSDELKAALAETLERGEQAIVLLNRRGFSSFLLCRSCGEAIHCPNCDVTLTYHRHNSTLLCHYCNYVRPVPRKCDNCEGQYIHYVGEGTEKLETTLREMFPNRNIARVDRDSTRRRGTLEHLLMQFAAGETDLLVGTQMLAKGHDFPNVTLVGVVSVDLGLSLPDFRSAERTFQLLTQVAGRAGRGELPGRVIIQTYHPEHYALVSARAQDYDGFYQREIEFRRAMHYPPFSALINILVHDKDYDKAGSTATQLGRELRAAGRESSVRVLGPAPAPLARLKGEHRFQILIKARSRKSAREALDAAMERGLASGHNPKSISVEVDPVSLM
jgi:primosomal protein N' (replication factor Y) (superfamily II helicase)